MPEDSKEIFISYAWGGESEDLVNQLDEAFQSRGITIIRDKRDLGFKGRIKAFMERIGRGKAIIVVISEKYLKSENCMFELVQIAKNGQFYDRIFPVVMSDANIYKPTQRIKYIQYWEKQIEELSEAMKTVSPANLQGFREDIDLYTEIRGTIAELTNLLKDMNTLTPSIHIESDFEALFKAVEYKLTEPAENQKASQNPILGSSGRMLEVVQVNNPSVSSNGLSERKRRRLEQERDSLQQQYDLVSEKLNRLREAFTLEVDPSTKLKLEKQRELTQTELYQLDEEIEHIEQQLH
jgi:hypothetical protein